MKNSIRFLLVAIAAVVLAFGLIAYQYLRKPTSPEPVDVDKLLSEMPNASSGNNTNSPDAWSESRALARYDTMQRSGATLLARWATNIRDACVASEPVTEVPDEKSWSQPVIVYQCFDGATVFEIHLN